MSQKSLDEDLSPLEEQTLAPIQHHDSLFGESETGQASVYLYKRDGESAAEILQPLISQDPRHFRWVSHNPGLCDHVTRVCIHILQVEWASHAGGDADRPCTDRAR